MNIAIRALCLFFVLLIGDRALAATPLPTDSVYQLNVLLTGQDGVRAPLAARRGKVQLVSMFYTSCTMVCPMIVDTLKATRQSIDGPARDRLDALVITFDPERDDVAALRRYAETRKLDARHWTLARTKPSQTRQLAALLNLQYRKLPDGDFNHSSELILLDRDGRIAARSNVIGRTDPAFVDAVRRALASP